GTRLAFSFVPGERGGLVQSLRYSDPGGASVDLIHPNTGSTAYRNYESLIRQRMNAETIPTTPGQPRVSAIGMFGSEARATMGRLAEAERKLRDNTMYASDLLPLAYQVESHLVEEASGRYRAGQSIDGVYAASLALHAQVKDAEAQAVREQR